MSRETYPDRVPEILSMTVCRERLMTASDKLVLGWFSFQARGLEFGNCTLFQTERGVRWTPPPFERNRPGSGSSKIYLQDRDLYQAITDAAVRSYQGLGGQHLTTSSETIAHHDNLPSAITRIISNSASDSWGEVQ